MINKLIKYLASNLTQIYILNTSLIDRNKEANKELDICKADLELDKILKSASVWSAVYISNIFWNGPQCVPGDVHTGCDSKLTIMISLF